jgi:hypothetical protein
MCTLLTIGAEQWSRAMENHIKDDAFHNPHGFALLLLNKHGARTILRSMDIEPILALLRNSDWERMFLHSRWATQGSVRLDNTHGWSDDGVFYMHNGCLMSKDGDSYPVDSQAIGEWIRHGGVDRALQNLQMEMFANVFMVDLDGGYYAVNRSMHGTLFTDGMGNYATNPIGSISMDVVPGVEYWWYVEGDEAKLVDQDDYEIDDDGLDDVVESALDEADREYLAWRARAGLTTELPTVLMDDEWREDDDGIGDYIPIALRNKRRA